MPENDGHLLRRPLMAALAAVMVGGASVLLFNVVPQSSTRVFALLNVPHALTAGLLAYFRLRHILYAHGLPWAMVLRMAAASAAVGWLAFAAYSYSELNFWGVFVALAGLPFVFIGGLGVMAFALTAWAATVRRVARDRMLDGQTA